MNRADVAPDALEHALAVAIDGDASAQRRFFEVLLEATLVVPERHQPRPLTDSPRYPNEFFNVLGLQHGERVVVPVFSRADGIERWCGNPLRHRMLRFSDLLATIPDEWWVCVNPGGGVEKELSPWELGLLRSGRAGIAEIVEDLGAATATTTVEIRALKDGEYPELRRLLGEFATSCIDISRVFILREEGGGERTAVVLIGVECFTSDQPGLDKVREEVGVVAGRGLIGAEPFRVFVGGRTTNNFKLTLFAQAEPVFQRAEPVARGWWQRLWSRRP